MAKMKWWLLFIAFFVCIFSSASCNLLNMEEDEEEKKTVYYTVSFSTSGGSSVLAQAVESGKTVSKPADPSKYKCRFDGWYTDTACTKSFDFSTPITSNVTLYAKWVVYYTVEFYVNGGNEVASQTVEAGALITKPDDPTKEGDTFVGWYTDSSFKALFDFSTPINADIVLFAKWYYESLPVYYVSFQSNGGTAVSWQLVKSGYTATKPDDPTKEDDSFLGWYTDSAFTTLFDFETLITANITLYAKWYSDTLPTYTVSFVSNGGSSVTSQSLKSGKVATAPVNPTKTACSFAGWYTDSSLKNKFAFSTAITSNITLYAKWIVIAPTNLNARTDGGNEIRISWTDTEASDYKVYYNIVNNANTATELTKKSSYYSSYDKTQTYYFEVPDLNLRQRVYFWVKAIKDSSESSLSSTVYQIDSLSRDTISTLLTTRLGAKGTCVAFKPSATPPSENVSFYYLNKDDATIWAEGTTIYYHTGKASKIPLPESAAGLFYQCVSLKEIDLSLFDSSSVTTMYNMFYGCSALESVNLSGFDTSNVTNMSYMFSHCALKELDLSSFNTSKVTTFDSMFSLNDKLTTIYVSANTDWASYIATSSSMFSCCFELKGGAGTVYNYDDNFTLNYAHVDSVDNPGFFTAKN